MPACTRSGAAGGAAGNGAAGNGAAGNGAVSARWERAVKAGETVTLTWSVRFESFGAATSSGAGDHSADPAPLGSPAPAAVTRAEATTVRSDREPFDRVIARGMADLALLVTPGPGPGQRHLSAGVPWFTTLFGRDAILASFAALLVDPSLAVDTLRVLASLQATGDDPAHDAEAGKIPHEIRDGEMARTGEVPFGRYYGAADTTPLWLVLLGETFDWTGDVDLVSELWPNALAALDWLERGGDPDGDGFIEYRRRAPGGLVNQGWKDALDAVQDRAGRVADGPIALVEVQGYAYDARIRMARLARAVGDMPLAERLDADAGRLRARFAEAYWVPDLATCALALDGAKRPMDAIGSNQGHALWSGIVDERHAQGVAERLAGPGLDSGWGMRTFAAGQPGYTPFGYHTGTVWPHDAAIAIAGLRRYGFDAPASRLAAGLLDAATRFPDARLPELFCGFSRDEVEDPVPYPVACSPQAWSAAAPLLVLRSLLGLRPRAADRELDLVRPILPEGVDDLAISGLAIGTAMVDLHVRRRRGRPRVEAVVRGGELTVTVSD